MSRVLTGALALLGLLVFTRVAAGLPGRRGAWIQVRTDHFTVFSNASSEKTLDLTKRLEKFRDLLSRLMPTFQLSPPVPTYVFIFKSASVFTPYRLNSRGQRIKVGGFFIDHRDADYIAIDSNDPQPMHLIYHEFVHHVLHNNLMSVPRWFDEGASELYSSFLAEENHANIALPVGDQVRWLRTHHLIPLRELFTFDPSSAGPGSSLDPGTFYAESWALVHYLFLGKAERRPQAVEFLDRLSRGEDLDDAFRETFHATFDEMTKELRAYLDRDRFSFTVATFKEALEEPTASILAPLPREEVLFRLGDLLLHMTPSRTSEAGKHFRKALEVNPSHALSWAGLGIVEADRGQFEEANADFDKALELAPGDPLISLLYGHCLVSRFEHADTDRRQVADLGRARELFGRTIHLRPDLAEAYAAFGETYSLEGAGAAAGITMLEKARQLLPVRMDIALNLASLYSRQGDFAKARDLVVNTVSRSSDRKLQEAGWALLTDDYLAAAESRLKDGKTDEGVALLREGIATVPDRDLRRKLDVRLRAIEEAAGLPGEHHS